MECTVDLPRLHVYTYTVHCNQFTKNNTVLESTCGKLENVKNTYMEYFEMQLQTTACQPEFKTVFCCLISQSYSCKRVCLAFQIKALMSLEQTLSVSFLLTL